MAYLENFTLANAKKTTVNDDTKRRRNKLLKAINIQKQVLAAAINGEKLKVPTKKGRGQRNVAPWFFAQDGGYYVRCRYGFRYLHFQDDNNALFVRDLISVGTALNALAEATNCGELDKAIAESITRRRN